ncbi:TRAP transporter large permease [Pseudonocardia nematodicida]|uniref:TRAP transporter large permease n=1 Tax=Pseudonocardia nematodicida TaxID=1206997 RepID=A0ABV1KL77_9PSEU
MTVALLVLGLFVGLFVLRLPVAFALLLPSVGYILLTGNVSFSIALQQVTGGIDSFVLLAIPLFILMGNLANAAGVTDRMFSGVQAVIGHVRGSYGYTNVLVSLGFSWMNGSALADIAGAGKMQVPVMVREGYGRRYTLGLTGAASMIGPIMPPSIPAVLFALTAGVSMGGMLIAGVLPALLITVVLLVTVWWMSRSWEHLRSPRPAPRVAARRVLTAAPALITPLILLGGILGGVFTPTEAAAAAAAYMLLLGVAYRSFSWSALRDTLRSTADTTAGVMVIIASATLFAWILSLERAPDLLAQYLVGAIDQAWVFLLVVNLLLLLFGAVMETGALILILVPVLLPAAEAFGIHPLHLGVVVVFNLMLGLLTPPMGLVLFVLDAVTGSGFNEVVRGVALFAAPLLGALALVTYVPVLSTGLPGLLGF